MFTINNDNERFDDLSKFTYFDHCYYYTQLGQNRCDRDGTILHATSFLNMICYTKILLTDGFNPYQNNRARASDNPRHMTPQSIAKVYKYYSILSSFNILTKKTHEQEKKVTLQIINNCNHCTILVRKHSKIKKLCDHFCFCLFSCWSSHMRMNLKEKQVMQHRIVIMNL